MIEKLKEEEISGNTWRAHSAKYKREVPRIKTKKTGSGVLFKGEETFDRRMKTEQMARG